MNPEPNILALVKDVGIFGALLLGMGWFGKTLFERLFAESLKHAAESDARAERAEVYVRETLTELARDNAAAMHDANRALMSLEATLRDFAVLRPCLLPHHIAERKGEALDLLKSVNPPK